MAGPGAALAAGIGLDLGPQAPGPGPVDRAVDDDPVQPGPERPARVEAAEMAKRGHE